MTTHQNSLQQLIESIVEEQLSADKAAASGERLSTNSDVEPKNMDVKAIAATIEDELY